MQFAPQVRGNWHQATLNHGTTKYHAGATTIITDTMVSLSGSTSFVVFSISKRYNSGSTEEWTINFGGLAPSVTSMIRRQTRGTLS